MIQTTEIMRGDLLYNHRMWVCPVIEVFKDSVTVIARHYGEETFKTEDMYPIPLTVDIISQNNFTIEDDSFGQESVKIASRKDFNLYVVFTASGKIYCGPWISVQHGSDYIDDLFVIKFVHELQHLLKSSKADSTIKIKE